MSKLDSDLKQLEAENQKFELNNTAYSVPKQGSREDLELIKLVLMNLTLRESVEELQLLELMLEDNEVWNQADALVRLRFYMNEMLRRKESQWYGITKRVFNYYLALQKMINRKNGDIKKASWEVARKEMVRIITDYVPSRKELGIDDFPHISNFENFSVWAKTAKELIDLGVINWNELIVKFNLNNNYLDFKGRFFADSVEFARLYQLCLELDERKKMNLSEKKVKSATVVCSFCKKQGHIEDNCFLKYPEKNPNAIKHLGYSENLNNKNITDVSKILCKINSESYEFSLDTGADASFIKWTTLLKILYNRDKVQIKSVDINFTDALKRPLIHCSYQIEMNVIIEGKVFKSEKFYVPDGDLWELNLIGKGLYHKLISSEKAVNFTERRIKYIQTKPKINQIHNAKSLEEIVDTDKSLSLQKPKKVKELWAAEINTPSGEYVTIHRKIDFKKLELAKELVKSLEEKGIVSKSNNYTNWLIPIQLVPKSNGKTRFCLDLRGLNELVNQDNYPIPAISNITDCLRNKKIFSKLDIKDGFFQVPLREKDREKTTFKIGTESYHFNVLPMGYRNAPNIFQRTMEFVLKEFIQKTCIVYIDDILIFSDDKESHKKHIQMIIQRLEEYGLEINKEKVEYFKEEIGFLGYVISENRIKPDHERTQGIQDYPTPKSVKDVRRFIGLLGYERRFLENLSESLAPLYELTKKGTRFKWLEEHEKAFKEAKIKMKNAVELVIPDSNGKFILETDASDTGMGAILKQEEGPIVFFSTVFNSAQKKYSITERELYAALWGMEKCKNYLYGREFDLITDHKAIEYYYKKDNFGNARIQRWFDKLSEFNFIPHYRPGEEMVSVDALSRSLVENITTEPSILNIRQDPCTDEVIIKLHESLNHRKSILEDLRKHNIIITKEKLADLLSHCKNCLEMDKKHVFSNRYIDTYNPGEIMGLDLMYYQKVYVIVMIDYYSRKAFTTEIKYKTAESVLSFVKEVYTNQKFKMLITDCGREFENDKIAAWLKSEGVIHHLRPPYYHKGSGRVERVIRTLRSGMDKVKGMIKVKLGNVTKSYNNTIHRAIGVTPEEALKLENRERVNANIENYKKEFKYKELPKYEVGDLVYIKNEILTSKEDKKFDKKGTIITCLPRDTYEVKTAENKIIMRNYSQLKFCPGML